MALDGHGFEYLMVDSDCHARPYLTALKNALDGANNNRNFVQPTPLHLQLLLPQLGRRRSGGVRNSKREPWGECRRAGLPRFLSPLPRPGVHSGTTTGGACAKRPLAPGFSTNLPVRQTWKERCRSGVGGLVRLWPGTRRVQRAGSQACRGGPVRRAAPTAGSRAA